LHARGGRVLLGVSAASAGGVCSDAGEAASISGELRGGGPDRRRGAGAWEGREAVTGGMGNWERVRRGRKEISRWAAK
jgi:hypothetical protein